MYVSRNICEVYNYTGYDILEEGEFEDTAAYIVALFLRVRYRCFVPRGVGNLLIFGRRAPTTPGQPRSEPMLDSSNDMKSFPH